MSEAELHILRARLDGGIRNKRRSGCRSSHRDRAVGTNRHCWARGGRLRAPARCPHGLGRPPRSCAQTPCAWSCSPRRAEIFVDDADLVALPAQRQGSLHQRILAGCRLSVVFDLSCTRLADIDERGTAQVTGLDFGIIHVPARAPPRFGAAIRSTPKRLIRIRYPPVRFISPSRQSPWPAPAQDAKTPRNIAPRADEGPEKSPIPGRGLTRLTAYEPGSPVPLEEKGRLKSLARPLAATKAFPHHSRL